MVEIPSRSINEVYNKRLYFNALNSDPFFIDNVFYDIKQVTTLSSGKKNQYCNLQIEA